MLSAPISPRRRQAHATAALARCVISRSTGGTRPRQPAATRAPDLEAPNVFRGAEPPAVSSLPPPQTPPPAGGCRPGHHYHPTPASSRYPAQALRPRHPLSLNPPPAPAPLTRPQRRLNGPGPPQCRQPRRQPQRNHPSPPRALPPSTGGKGYEVDGEEDEGAAINQREDEDHRLHPATAAAAAALPAAVRHAPAPPPPARAGPGLAPPRRAACWEMESSPQRWRRGGGDSRGESLLFVRALPPP